MLILDEPTDGLDPNQKHEVRNLIRELGKNKAIVFSTHILEEVDAACTRAIIIDRGRIVASGTPDELRPAARRGVPPHHAAPDTLPASSTTVTMRWNASGTPSAPSPSASW